jgi:Fe2+ transport system protein FeoA
MNSLPNQTITDLKSTGSNSIRFSELKAGARAVVCSLDGGAHDVARLSEIGFRRGAEFTLVRSGSTSIVRINHQALCLRLSGDIEVQVLPQSS